MIGDVFKVGKKKNRSISGQVTYAINKCFKEGIDKRAYKSSNGIEMGDKIFSYSEKFRLKSMAKSLQNYLKENDIKVKYIKYIKPEHIQGYLENAKANGCTQNTLDTYASSFFKIQNIVNSTYGVKLSWRNEIVIPKAIRHKSNKRGVESVISRSDYNKILKYAEENVSESGYAVRLQDFLGVRVEEVARISKNNISLVARTINLTNTKGGRELIREIPGDKVCLVKEILDKNYNEERLLSIKGDSINRYLNRVEDKLNIERHSNHDIRRLIAQEKYDSYRLGGMSIKEADSEVSKWLNHNDDRTSLLEKSYIVLR